jgi:hypothetical protein
MGCINTVRLRSTPSSQKNHSLMPLIDFNDIVDDFMDALHPEIVSGVYNINLTHIAKVTPTFEILRPSFCWDPIELTLSNKQFYHLICLWHSIQYAEVK